MPHGYAGDAPQRRLTKAAELLSAAAAAHNKDPFSDCAAGSVPLPSLPFRQNQGFPYENDYNTGFSMDVGNETNIVLDEQVCVELNRRLNRIDDEMAWLTAQALAEIDDMCKTCYILPATLPRYRALLDSLRALLPDYHRLANDIGSMAYGYAAELVDIR